MSKYSYLVELETTNIFNTSINKVILCKSAELAYEYGLKLEPLIKRDMIYNIENALSNSIIWETNCNFPRYKCKINKIDCDLLWSLYTDIDMKLSLNRIVQNIYTNLKINNFIK